MTYPTRQQAQILWKFSDEMRKANPEIRLHDIYYGHSYGVAKCAETIASKSGLDVDKAFVLGLLHDFGKIQKEWKTGVFHGKYGYDFFMNIGYTDVARICLTHSFVAKPIEKQNHALPKEWLDWADELLEKIEYDDYDKLIQLCDLLVELGSYSTLEDRFEGIQRRWNISDEQKKILLKTATSLKHYFDTKCSCDVYDLLEINR